MLHALAKYGSQFYSEKTVTRPITFSLELTTGEVTHYSEKLTLSLPDRGGRSSNPKPNFGYDYVKYVLMPMENDLFWSLQLKMAKEANDNILMDGIQKYIENRVVVILGPDKKKATIPTSTGDVFDSIGTWVVVTYKGQPITNRDKVSIWVASQLDSVDSAGVGKCLITGEQGKILRLHPNVRGVGGKGQAPLLSYNDGSSSYRGSVQGGNFPVSSKGADYVIGLNKLLSEISSRAHMTRDISVVMWPEKGESHPLIPPAIAFLGGQYLTKKDKTELLDNLKKVGPVSGQIHIAILQQRAGTKRIIPRGYNIIEASSLQESLSRFIKEFQNHSVLEATRFWHNQDTANSLFFPILWSILKGDPFPRFTQKSVLIHQIIIKNSRDLDKEERLRPLWLTAIKLREINQEPPEMHNKDYSVEPSIDDYLHKTSEDDTNQYYQLGRAVGLFCAIKQNVMGSVDYPIEMRKGFRPQEAVGELFRRVSVYAQKKYSKGYHTIRNHYMQLFQEVHEYLGRFEERTLRGIKKADYERGFKDQNAYCRHYTRWVIEHNNSTLNSETEIKNA